MTADKLRKIEREIAAARRRRNKHRDLERIAKSLGQRLKGAQARGREPSYENPAFPKTLITIPDHGPRDIAPGTQAKILDQIEEDVWRWKRKLEEQEKAKGTIIKGNGYAKD